MAETHETIADILAEMRNRAKRPDFGSQDVLKSCADRLEAAHKRERGDVAKLREAVKDAYDKLLLWNYTDGDTARMALGVMNKLDAALAAPPRNCDRFATIDEARKAHEAICEKYGKCHNGCPLNNEEHYSAFDCFEAWLYALATEKEGGAE